MSNSTTDIQTMRSIKNYPKHLQPREKINNLGPKNLSDEELLALILGSGSKTANVLTLAKKILGQFNSLQNLSIQSKENLLKIKGIGPNKADKILATLEIGRRLNQNNLVQLNRPEDAFRELDSIRNKNQEHLVCLYLDARHQLLEKETIAIGTVNHNFVEARDILAPALKLPCCAFILGHNHPSGNPQPSEDDFELTLRIHSAAQILGIKLIDHAIVTKNSNYSMRQHAQPAEIFDKL